MQETALGRLMLLLVGLTVVATAVGLAVYWPDHQSFDAPPGLTPPRTVPARVTSVQTRTCTVPEPHECQRVSFLVLGGNDRGGVYGFTVEESAERVSFRTGDRIRVLRNGLPEDAVIGGVRADPYAFSDFERRSSLLWLAIVFGIIVVLTGRFQGFRALAGLAASLGIVIWFVVPAILSGQSPKGVAIFGAMAVMLVTMGLAHGIGPKTVAAALGTTVALLLTLGLGDAFADLAHLTGLSSDEAVYLRAVGENVSLQGLLLAGVVIGALGVLDDLTITQASTVLALKHANPALGAASLFRRALAVGHDHIAATVNTLVLAYVGAALPVLLIFKLGSTSFTDAVNNESVATEIVSTLVGSIGLIAAVPITTGLAVLLAGTLSRERLHEAAEHGHAH